MGAFWSATDDANENATQFYGVWGKISSEQPTFLFRYVDGKHKNNISADILFDYPKVVSTIETTKVIHNQVHDPDGIISQGVRDATPVVTQEKKEFLFHGPYPRFEYPADWMEQHTTPKYTFKTPSTSRSKYVGSKQTSWDDYYGQAAYDDYGYPHYARQDFLPDEEGTQTSLSTFFTDELRIHEFPYSPSNGFTSEDKDEAYDDFYSTALSVFDVLVNYGIYEKIKAKEQPLDQPDNT